MDWTARDDCIDSLGVSVSLLYYNSQPYDTSQFCLPLLLQKSRIIGKYKHLLWRLLLFWLISLNFGAKVGGWMLRNALAWLMCLLKIRCPAVLSRVSWKQIIPVCIWIQNMFKRMLLTGKRMSQQPHDYDSVRSLHIGDNNHTASLLTALCNVFKQIHTTCLRESKMCETAFIRIFQNKS